MKAASVSRIPLVQTALTKFINCEFNKASPVPSKNAAKQIAYYK